MKFDVKSLLKDKNVLYIVSFLAITNMLSYLFARNYDAVVFFVVVGFLTTYFSKNMIVVMLVAMLSTNLFMGTKVVTKKIESMATRQDDEEKESEDKKLEAMENEKEEGAKPSNEDKPENQTDSNGKKKSKIDYAATLEEAYDNLEGLIGKSGIEKMTADSANLLKKQEALVQSMKGMEPLLQNAQKMMESFDVKNLEKMSSMLTGTMNKLGGIGAAAEKK
jgi:hypothetical protein